MECPRKGDRATVRQRERLRAILAEAARSFDEHGYAATSMSAIATALGCSKTTLWSRFPTKEALFAAYLDSRIDGFAAALEDALIPAGGTSAALARFGRVFLARILSEESAALRRLISAEGRRFPEIAEAFFRRGPLAVRHRLARYLEGEMMTGRLRAGDADLAARQFLALCQAGVFADRVWLGASAGEDETDRDVAAAVYGFLRAWAAPSPAGPAACS